MTRSVCLKRLRSLIASAHDHVAKADCEFLECHEALIGPWEEARKVVAEEIEKATAALQVALHGELGVAPPGYDPDFCKENDIDPNGVPCECSECRPAKDVSRG